jgi:hypothetical protein
MGQTSTTGVLSGRTITLDAPIPDLDGRRVRVVLAAAEEQELVLAGSEQEGLWLDWVRSGPQGPIEEEEGASDPA